MKVSMSWINEFVDIQDITPHQYAEDMTMSGSKVEGILYTGKEISNVVAGKILSCEPHPDADKLQICQVDAGKETVQIVTGAKNVKAGDMVPVALHKSTLPGGVKITKGNLRGVQSCGMMCSHEELGMDLADYEGACEDGILHILEPVAAGTDIKEVLGLNEHIVEFEITSNRADCFSVIGLARETAVTFRRPLQLHTPVVAGNAGNLLDQFAVEVHDTALCPRYAARMVKNVKIAPSPKWMREKLKSCGVRPINNIVDITNYVLLEYGQPMHAFDVSYLSGGKIVVRRAGDGEQITTLDGVQRALDSSMLVIADGAKPVAVAGVMGGENSEIQPDTSAILFECANFDGASVRVTAKKLGLRTEASSRYEKGLDPAMIPDALSRACELVEMLGAGEVVGGVIDVNASDCQSPAIAFEPEKINRLLGCDISGETMTELLKSLEFKVENGVCYPPTFRRDIEGMADVAEEVARLYGYNNIPTTLLRGETTPGGRNRRQLVKDAIKEIFVGLGGYEIMTYSFTSPKLFDQLLLPPDDSLRNTVKIINPLGEENSVMRTTMVGSMLDTLARNYSFRNTSVKLFETGTVYLPKAEGKLPDEIEKITVGMYGNVDFYDIKGAVEDLLHGLRISGYSFRAKTENPSFHPGRTAQLIIGGSPAGVLGEIHPLVAENFGIPVKTYVAQLDFDLLFTHMEYEKSYVPLPKFPSIARDIAVLVDDDVLVFQIEEIIAQAAGKLLEELKLFDVYKGSQIPGDKKSVAYSLTLRSADRTLTDAEVGEIMDKIVKNLTQQLNAQLR